MGEAIILYCRLVAAPSTHEGPELFFGLAAAAGTDLDAVAGALESALHSVDYDVEQVRLSRLLDWIDWSKLDDAPQIDDNTLDRHISTRMDAGNYLREKLQRGDALALLAILNVARLRADPRAPMPRRAYILRSLKHPQEVDTLREVYGPNFFLVSAYAPAEMRAGFLERAIAHDWERRMLHREVSPRGTAWDLIERDKQEAHLPFGQKLGDTFPLADIFVDSRDHQKLQVELLRFVEIIFGHPFHTPARDENAMFHAHAAALRSAAPGRQVGAVITTVDGSIVGVGTNEVPKAGGGQYWSDDDSDNRDHNRNDPNVSGTEKRVVVEQILRRLREVDWLAPALAGVKAETFYDLLKGLRVQSLIEFERAVHAEMSAIIDAARRGVSVANCQLYTTTFPCHECTRHLIAAGITRLVYIEPYPKSLAARLHDDAIAIDPDHPPEGKVVFVPFVGVAPRRYLELFTPSIGTRKVGDQVAAPKPGRFPKSVPGAST